MPKINHEEYEVLKGLDDKWEWITRDSYRDEREYENVLGGIRVFSKKPFKFHRGDHFGMDGTGMGVDWLYLDRDMFFFIKPYDEEPHNIAEMIEEYESEEGKYEMLLSDFLGRLEESGIDTSRIVIEESEETEMKKDIKWANEEIKKERNLLNDKRYEREVDDLTTGVLLGLKKALNIFNQLDEPEVLTQEWVENNSVYANSDGLTEEYVHVDDLQNLLVPKQELPVIPKFVADWYEEHKDNLENQLLGIAFNLDKYREMPEVNDLDKWINETEYPLQILASLRLGYEVKKEQKYYVSDIEGNILLWKTSKGVRKTNSEVKLGQYDDWAILFTEQEIKDYDERYFAFAVPAEEDAE